MAQACLTIDLGALVTNWRALDARSGAGVETAAVVKADAYGLGAEKVAPALRAAGARSFFVALAEEGAALRSALGEGPAIYVFSGLMSGDAALCREYGLVPCLNSPEQVERFLRELPGRPSALQLDSGMNRLGLEPAELDRVAEHLPNLNLMLAMSHLACADEPGHPANAAQRTAFRMMLERVGPIRASLAATGGVVMGEEYHFGMTRPGIGLYGGLPFAEARPVVRLALPVIQVRQVETGEAVGYGAGWVAQRPSRIATVAAGYADGLIRRMGEGKVNFRAGDVPCPVVGRVSMDLITVDVTELADVPESLEILNERQGVDALASEAGTIGYEILTALGGRYDRVYRGLPA